MSARAFSFQIAHSCFRKALPSFSFFFLSMDFILDSARLDESSQEKIWRSKECINLVSSFLATQSASTLPVERRFWPGYPEDLYTLEQWRQFIVAQNPCFDDNQVDAEVQRLWRMSKSRLCDQPFVDLVDLNSVKDSSMVVFVSCRRSAVDILKPILRKMGFIVTFGRPGDALSGLRSKDTSTWTYPWLAKNIGAISAAYFMQSSLSRINLVYLDNYMGSGSQSEWELFDTLKSKVCQEIGEPVQIITVVVNTCALLERFGHNLNEIEKTYYTACRKIFMIRHCQSEANIERDMMHPGLTSQGVEQAVNLGTMVRDLDADFVVSSPHKRCLQTLRYLKFAQPQSVVIAAAIAEFNRHELQNKLPTLNQTAQFLEEQDITSVEKVELQSDGYEDSDLAVEAIAYLGTLPGRIFILITHKVFIRELIGIDVNNGSIVEADLECGSIENARIWKA